MGVAIPSVPGKWGQRLAVIALSIGVALAAFAWLNHLNPVFLISDDGVRDQLLVRDCADLGHCHLVGAPASFGGFHHGAAWLDLLIAVRLLGGDTAAERIVVLALSALSVATLFVVVCSWLRASIALPAALILTAALGLDKSPSFLVAPSVAAFPDIFTAIGLFCYALSGQSRFLLVAAFALGVGINVHVGSVSLIAPLAAVAALAGPRPWRDLLAALIVLLVTCVITSSAALLANLRVLVAHGWGAPVLAGGILVVLLCVGFGPRFRRLSWDARVWLTGLILLLPFGFGSLWLVFWQQHHFGLIYLHPILGPAAVLVSVIICFPFEGGARYRAALRWIPTVASLAVIASVVPPVVNFPQAEPGAEANSWTLAEGRVIAEQAMQRGWSYEDLVFHLQSPGCHELLRAMSATAPPPARVPNHHRMQLQVMRFDRDAVSALAERQDIVALGSSRVALLREIESWLQPESLTACRTPVGSGQAPTCAAARPMAALAPQRFLFATRSFPEIHSLDLSPPYIATYEIPVSPAAGASRNLTVSDRTAPGCGWRITRVDGLGVDRALPAAHVRVRSDDGRPGLLVIEKPFGTTACANGVGDLRYPPCVIETELDDPFATMAETE